MSTVLGKSEFTPEDLLRLSGDDRFELVQGQLVSTEMSGLAAFIAYHVAWHLGNVVRPAQLGTLFTSDASYQCFAEAPDRVRRPDVSFIHRSRMQPEYLQGHIPVPPDLAVEVVSPNDLFYDVRQKVGEYLRAGVRLVWVVNPVKEEVDVYRANGTSVLARAGDCLEGEDVIPGFRCPLADIFQRPPMDSQK
jgi:Uma2 family endonuclease